jgi:signal transduction histidine kinase
MRNPLAQAIVLTNKLLAGPNSICLEDVMRTVVSIKSLVMRVHFRILDIIDLSSVERNEFKKKNCFFDVKETIISIKNINSLQSGIKNVFLRCRFSSQIPLNLFGDPQRIQQVLQNLVLNAIKFSENCVVEIHTSYEEKTHLLRIDVVDEGVGIPKSEKNFVFNKFCRCFSNIEMNPNGIGLGLHISKQIMSHLGGEISFESKDHCTTFSVHFPISTNSEVLRKP